MTKRRTAAEIIAFHFCTDIRDVQECRYQPTRYASPAIYTMGDDYYCSPPVGASPPAKFGKWEAIGTHYDRTVYRCRMDDRK
jgi:hypothetical protein